MNKKHNSRPAEQKAADRLKILESNTKLRRYLYRVFNDPEFINEVSDFKESIRKNYTPEMLSVGYDFGFMKQKGVPVLKDDLQIIKTITTKYRISETTLYRYMDGHYKDEDDPINLIYHQISEDRGQIVLRIHPNMTETQFRALWYLVECQKAIMGLKVRRRNRPPSNGNDKLIYCIGKHLTEGEDLDDAYRLYQDSKLPGYTSTELDTSFSLKEFKAYYEKYRFF